MSYLDELFGLHGRRALVTGAAGGIGRASADALEAAGATVFRADVEHADVSDEAAVDALIARVLVELGGLDIVHSNAGIISGLQPELDVSYADWKRNIEVNLGGMFLVGRAAARAMNAGGSIINTASMSGLLINRTPGEPANGSAYAAAKAGVIQLTRSQAVQWVDRGIRVNAISPGYIASGIHAGFSAEKLARREAQVPMGRFGETAELAGAIVYLAGNASSYVTGANLVVDGGYTCW